MSLARAPRGPGWLPVVLAISLLYWTFDLAVLRAGATHPLDDHWEEVVIARHLIIGDGFRSDVIYPPMWGFRDPRTLTVPMMIHGPLLPVLMTVPLALLGPRPLESPAWGAALIAWLTVIPLFRVAVRHFGERVAAVAALLFTLAPLTTAGVHHSASVIAGALLVIWALERFTDEPAHPLAAGLLAALAYLARPEMLLGALAMAVFSLEPARRRGLIRFAVGFALPVIPWWLHQARALGSPWFNLSGYTLAGVWGDRPGYSILRDFDLTPDRFPAMLRAALPGLWRKWAEFLPHAVWRALRATSTGTGWLAPIGLIAVALATRAGAPLERLPNWLGVEPGSVAPPRATRRFALLALLIALIPILSGTIVLYIALYFVTFMPIYAIGVAVGAQVLGARLHLSRTWPAVIALLLAPSVVNSLRTATGESHALTIRVASERAKLSMIERARSPRLMCSDTPDFVAWTTGRPTLWLTRDDFERLYAAGGAEAARRGLPARADVGTWFHGDAADPRSLGFSLSRAQP